MLFLWIPEREYYVHILHEDMISLKFEDKRLSFLLSARQVEGRLARKTCDGAHRQDCSRSNKQSVDSCQFSHNPNVGVPSTQN